MKIEIKPYDLSETIVDSIIQDLSERNGYEAWGNSSYDIVIDLIRTEWITRVAKILYEQLDREMDKDITFPPLEVSDRTPCEMCGGLGRVMCTPGRGEPYEVPCEYCGGCGKMGIYGYPYKHVGTYGYSNMDEAPRTGKRISLLIPYNPCPEWDVGYWCDRDNCWRFDGDDGPNDIQPIRWNDP